MDKSSGCDVAIKEPPNERGRAEGMAARATTRFGFERMALRNKQEGGRAGGS